MYELIFIDHSMFTCNGIKAIEEMRSFLKANRVVEQPFICCLTANDDEGLNDTAKEAGIDAFYVKPIFADTAGEILQQARILL